MKNLTLTFVNVEQEHLGKDVFLVPYYLGKINSCSVSIVFPETETNKMLPEEYMGVRLIRVRGRKSKSQVIRELCLYRYIWKHAKDMDFLMRCHNKRATVFAVLIYKLRNPKGYAYVKCDIDANKLPVYGKKADGTNSFFNRLLARRYVRLLDCASCELRYAYDKLRQKKKGFFALGDKLRLIPNGFDEALFQSLDIREKKSLKKRTS